MTKYDFLSAVGQIEPELIEKSETFRRRSAKKGFAVFLAAALIIAFSVSAGAFGFFSNKISEISVKKDFPERSTNIEEYTFSFDVEIAEDAKEYITDYYLPMLLVESENVYKASANSFAGYVYLEESEKNEFIAYSQHSVIGFDYSIGFDDNVNIKESEFELDGIKINCHEVFSAKDEKPLYKMFHWSDGYYIFEIMCSFKTENDYIAEVIKSVERIEDFSEYGKIRENRYHG
ncbi:MAG: hypothetical protein IKL57_04120 [Oscillospiraceae bacterium]|nr:hypothetical protein [Oscillospiraceae bacterium]